MQKSKFRGLCALMLGLLVLQFNARGQSAPAPASEGPLVMSNIDTWVIPSATIGEDFHVYVLRPAAYDSGDAKFPVLYMMDGDWSMTVAMNCFSMLRQDYETRFPLVVGIGYGKGENKRTRDLNPQTGGPAFLTFIEKEVMPFIEKQYTDGEKAVYGYSMGGMFTTYILFNRPDLFNMVFIGAPGNAGRDLLPSAKKYFNDHDDLKSKVFVGVGSCETAVVRQIDTLKTYLLAKRIPSLQFKAEIAPDVNHGAGLALVMQNAIAYGYCRKHELAKVDPAVFGRYKGTYVNEDKSLPQFTVFTKDKKLYFRVMAPGNIPVELLPQSDTQYFTIENERYDFSFVTEGGKPKLVVVNEAKKEYSFTRTGK